MIIDKTKSICPICFKTLSATVISKKNKVYLDKTCKEHGNFSVKIADEMIYFKKLRELYFKKNKSNGKMRIYDIYLNQDCNIKCPICYVDTHKRKNFEPSLKSIKNKLLKIKKCDINLLGGEPTLRKDLPEIIEIIEKSKNNSVLFTNGIKLANLMYCKKLKNAGLKDVRFSFEGFNDKAYKKIRGTKLTKIKLKALNNLKKLNIPTLLEVTVVKGTNEKELIKILNFTIKNNFIKAISFRSITELGSNKLKRRVTVDEMLSNLGQATNNKINKRDVFNFQKYFYYLSNLLNLKECFYNQYYILFRNKKSYIPFSKMYDLKLNINEDVNLKKIFKNFTNNKTSLKLVPLFFKILLYKNLNLRNINGIILLRFGDSCDPYTFDYKNAKNCPGLEINFKNEKYKTTAISNMFKDKELKCSLNSS